MNSCAVEHDTSCFAHFNWNFERVYTSDVKMHAKFWNSTGTVDPTCRTNSPPVTLSIRYLLCKGSTQSTRIANYDFVRHFAFLCKHSKVIDSALIIGKILWRYPGFQRRNRRFGKWKRYRIFGFKRNDNNDTSREFRRFREIWNCGD